MTSKLTEGPEELRLGAQTACVGPTVPERLEHKKLTVYFIYNKINRLILSFTTQPACVQRF